MKIATSSIRKIAIFRALQLGDMLCSIPAIRTLRNAYPAAEISLLGLPWAQSLVARFPHYIDKFIHFPGYPGLPEQRFDAVAFADFLVRIQKENFDLVLQMQGNGNIVNPMVELFGASTTAGFYFKDNYHPDNGFFVEYPTGVHEIERHLALMKHIHLKPCGSELEFPMFDEDYEELNKLELPIRAGNYVCIHPGSRGAWRQWPTENFAAVADYCAERNYRIVITGTKDEMAIIDQVTSFMKNEAIVLAGKTSLGAVAALIKDARLLVSNCTGVSHIAAATKTPSIVISMDGEPERWGPLDHRLHKTIDWTKTNDMNEVMSGLKGLLSVTRKVDQFRDGKGLVRS